MCVVNVFPIGSTVVRDYVIHHYHFDVSSVYIILFFIEGRHIKEVGDRLYILDRSQ